MKPSFRLTTLLLLLMLTALPGLRGSGPAVAGAPAKLECGSGELNIIEWSGYEDPDFWTDFKKNCPHVEVEGHFEFGATDAEIYAKTKTVEADILHVYTSWAQRYVEEGLVQEITDEQLKRFAYWDKVPDSLKAKGRFNGKQYFIPWDWGFSAILYRKDLVKAPIDSWKALFEDQYKNRVAMFDDGPSAVSVYCYIQKFDGHECDETHLTDKQLAAIKAKWQDQKFALFWDDEDSPHQLVQAMSGSNPNVVVAYAWQSAYAKLKQKGFDVEYINPKEGRTSWVGLYGIRRGAKNPTSALRFLDEKLAEATATNVVEKFYYGVANQEVMHKTFSDPLIKQILPTGDPNVELRTNFTPELTGKQLDADGDMWGGVIAP